MNRFKKELKRKGVRLEGDYPFLPYEVGDNIYMEGVSVDAETATFTEYLNVIVTRFRMDRHGEIMAWYTKEELKMRKGAF